MARDLGADVSYAISPRGLGAPCDSYIGCSSRGWDVYTRDREYSAYVPAGLVLECESSREAFDTLAWLGTNKTP